MTAYDDAEAGAGGPAGLLGQLERHAVEAHDVVLTDHASLFLAEDLREVDGAERNKSRGGISGRPRERRVVVGDEVVPEVGVGSGEGGEAGEA